MFGETPSFEINGEGSYNTLIGTLLSILILIIVIPYGHRKYVIMNEYNDTNFAEAVVKRSLIENLSAENALGTEEMGWALALTLHEM